jgi:hypothetical protein
MRRFSFPALARSSAFLAGGLLRMSSSEASPPPSGPVLVHTPPDFDGEEPRNAPAASRGPATARGAASAPISGSGISNSVSPVICVRRTLSGVQGTAASIQ